MAAVDAGGRLFVAHPRVVRGISRSGKQFFSFRTSLSAGLRAIAVEGDSLLAATQSAILYVVNGEAQGTVRMPLDISALLVVGRDASNRCVTLVATQALTVAVVIGTSIVHHISTGSGVPTCFANFVEGPDGVRHVLVGTDAGDVLCLRVVVRGR